MTADPTSTPSISELSDADIDDTWAFFERIPEGDRTFVKEPVTGRDTVASWLTNGRGRRLLVRCDDRVVGYVAVVPAVGWSQHVGELRLVVDPEVRRRGIGQTLARHALRLAIEMGLTKVVVEVVAEQESTIALFTGLGFRAEALLVDQVKAPDGQLTDLLVLANRTDADWSLLETVGLDQPLG